MNPYSIPLRNLQRGRSTYSFDCGQEFFAGIEDSLIDDANIHAEVVAQRGEQLITLDIAISGTVRAVCDICLGEFDYEVEDCGGHLTLRLGEELREIGDDVYEVDERADELDLSQWIYEFVCVSLPIRFEHPEDENGNSTCDPDMLARLEDLDPANREEDDVPTESDEIDPRWAKLAYLKDNDKN